MKNLTLISDDLTGTVDCSSLARGCDLPVKVTVCTDGNEKIFGRTEEREIIAVNLSSRTIPGEEAYQRTYDAALKLKDFQDQIIMKKMDTGFRGNAGYEIDGILDALDTHLCFIMDHIPIRKTFTLYGHQYAAGQILEKSVFAQNDKLKAPAESYIPNIISKQTKRKVCSIDIDAVKGGTLVEKVKEAVEAGYEILVLDAISEADGLNNIQTLSPIFPSALWAGSTGLVEALIKILYGPVHLHTKKVLKEQSIGFSGTAYKKTFEQLEYAKEKTGLSLVRLDIDRILSGEKEESIKEASEKFIEENKKGNNVIMCPAVSADSPYEKKKIAEAIMEGLSLCAKIATSKTEFDRLVVIGGETSQAIFAAFDIYVLYMEEPPEVGTGEGMIGDGPLKGKKFSIKGGSIGDKNSVLRMLGLWGND